MVKEPLKGVYRSWRKEGSKRAGPVEKPENRVFSKTEREAGKGALCFLSTASLPLRREKRRGGKNHTTNVIRRVTSLGKGDRSPQWEATVVVRWSKLLLRDEAY